MEATLPEQPLEAGFWLLLITTSQDAVKPFEVVTVIVALPSLSAVINPLELTLAISVSLLDHCKLSSMPLGESVAFNLNWPPHKHSNNQYDFSSLFCVYSS